MEQPGGSVGGLISSPSAAPVNSTTTAMQRLLDAPSLTNEEVFNELLLRASERLRVLARRKLRGFPALQRWVETDDVLQQSMLRLHRALEQVRPATVGAFFGLAGLQIRRELHDLHRHHFGPHGVGANHQTDGESHLPAVAAGTELPVAWDRFHNMIEALPDEERAVVDLLFVSELTQEDAAQVLGVSLRTVKRRWQSARLRLGAAIEREEHRDDG